MTPAPVQTARWAKRPDGEAVSVNYAWTGRYFDRQPYPSRGFGIGIEVGGGLTLSGSKSPQDALDTAQSSAQKG